MKTEMNTFYKLAIFLIITVALVIAANLAVIFLPYGEKGGEPVEVRIERGASAEAIADTLKNHELIAKRENFLLAVRIFRQYRNLKAGFYKIPRGKSAYQLMRIIARGKTARIKVTIPEGLTSFQIASIFKNKLALDSTEFISLVHDANLCKELKVDANSLEGYLFPETYFFDWGTTCERVIKRMHSELMSRLSDSSIEKFQSEGWTLHQILTLASLIEWEAIVDSERQIISAVFRNRLRKGMLLQSCATVQYIIPDSHRRLLLRDLQIDSPYNTYKYPGLPPGPINNPGLKSILAAIYPADVDYLYFVAKGDGSHTFSTTLRGHLNAKTKLDEIRRKLALKKKYGKK